jgi:hypothetical protein
LLLKFRQVDKQITFILQERHHECLVKEGVYDGIFKCANLKKDYDEALANYFIKYGDLQAQSSAIVVYMKQKHRLIWQRRNPDKDVFGFSEFDIRQKETEKAAGVVHDKDRF